MGDEDVCAEPDRFRTRANTLKVMVGGKILERQGCKLKLQDQAGRIKKVLLLYRYFQDEVY